MKNLRKIAVLTASMALALQAVPFAAAAEDAAYIYGTMDIPYADFYQAELADSSNAYAVDAVSSATNTKWAKNGEGELFEGSYHSEAAEDGSGQILGVTYPVALTQADLDALGENNFNFTALETAPEAYKIVTLNDGKAEFSAVQDAAPQAFEAEINLSTETPWGDYVISVNAAPEDMGAIYGAVLKTEEGHAYAMRHEQNIWRGQFAWSSGIKITEPHGNSLDFENYKTLMGETINEIVYIAKSGYYTVSTETYVPVKFENTLTVENGAAGTNSVNLTQEGFPEDYQSAYEIAENFSVGEDGIIAYTDAQPGTYTLTVSDSNEKYAPVSASFVLSTEDLPVAFDAATSKLIPAENFTQEQADNFLANLAKVSVNDKEYSASGKGSVAVINKDGTLNLEAASGRGDTATPVFNAEDGAYTLTVTATGYDTPLTFTFNTSGASTTTTADTTTTTTTNTTTTTTTTTKTNNNSNNNSSSSSKTSTSSSSSSSGSTSSSNSESPKTGDSAAIPVAVLAAAGLTALVAKKKK